MLNRRWFLMGAAATAASTLYAARAEIPVLTASGDLTDFKTLSDGEWRKRLSPEAYYVLRNHGTERAGTSPLNREKHKGTFACAGCELPLFSSDAKFESGTG